MNSSSLRRGSSSYSERSKMFSTPFLPRHFIEFGSDCCRFTTLDFVLGPVVHYSERQFNENQPSTIILCPHDSTSAFQLLWRHSSQMSGRRYSSHFTRILRCVSSAAKLQLSPELAALFRESKVQLRTAKPTALAMEHSEFGQGFLPKSSAT